MFYSLLPLCYVLNLRLFPLKSGKFEIVFTRFCDIKLDKKLLKYKQNIIYEFYNLDIDRITPKHQF